MNEKVTLLGSKLSFSSFPREDVEGQLRSEPAGIVFEPTNRAYPPVAIPYEAMERCGWDHAVGKSGADRLLWSFLLIVIYASLGHISPVYKYVWVVYQDERFQTSIEVHFKVGGWYSHDQTVELARQIWAGKEEYLRLRHDSTIIHISR